MKYSDLTFNDSNSFKRYLQNRRLELAVKSIKDVQQQQDKTLRILDFGCANAELYKFLKGSLNNFSYTGYDPDALFIDEANQNLGKHDNCQLTSDIADIIEKKFDLIFCLEVFEHLPDETLLKEINLLHNLLDDNSYLLIGVPNEIFMISLIRGIFRMTRSYGEYDSNFKNIFLSSIGMPPQDRPVSLKVPFPYFRFHMGFDYRRLKNQLSITFKIVSVFGSPLSKLPLFFNTEVYMLCKKK